MSGISKVSQKWMLISLIFFILVILSAVLFFEGRINNEVYMQCSTAYCSNTKKININTANENELKELKYLNSSQIKALTLYRKEHGDFICEDEILKVKGIGIKTYQKIKDRICV